MIAGSEYTLIQVTIIGWQGEFSEMPMPSAVPIGKIAGIGKRFDESATLFIDGVRGFVIVQEPYDTVIARYLAACSADPSQRVIS